MQTFARVSWPFMPASIFMHNCTYYSVFYNMARPSFSQSKLFSFDCWKGSMYPGIASYSIISCGINVRSFLFSAMPRENPMPFCIIRQAVSRWSVFLCAVSKYPVPLYNAEKHHFVGMFFGWFVFLLHLAQNIQCLCVVADEHDFVGRLLCTDDLEQVDKDHHLCM